MGPNYAWHIDGYDKLKPWGFPVHCGIDGYSRRVLWLNVTRSNNAPDNIACFYLDSMVAVIQAFFRDYTEAHRYVSSPRNQRIEGLWSQLCKQRSCWWRNFFKDLESAGEIHTTSEIKMEALWFAFSKIIQDDLDRVKEHWNTHRIRKSKFQTVAGRPDSLYFLPEETYTLDCKQEISQNEFRDVSENVVVREYANEYTEYFNYLLEDNNIQSPNDWGSALELYRFILSVCQLIKTFS